MASAETERQVVVFSLGGEHYGLPITAVREIIRYTAPSATATARGAIRGMIILRGRTLPIVDLSSRLGQELEVGLRTRILVLEVAGDALGLIVDGVDGILPIAADRIEALPVTTGEDAIGDEVAAVGERLIVLIDPDRAFAGLLPGKPAARTPATRRRKTTSARPRTSS
jgi:purine-binding chemotaxis protein CheW